MQNKTKQNKTKQNKTKQNKNKASDATATPNQRAQPHLLLVSVLRLLSRDVAIAHIPSAQKSHEQHTFDLGEATVAYFLEGENFEEGDCRLRVGQAAAAAAAAAAALVGGEGTSIISLSLLSPPLVLSAGAGGVFL
jgi:hypothetical protein